MKPLSGLPDFSRHYSRFALMGSLDRALRTLLRMGGGLMVLSLAAFFAAAEWVRWILLFILGAGLPALAASAVMGAVRDLRPARFCKALAARSPLFRDLESAVELCRGPSPDGISQELTDELVRSVQETLRKEDPSRWFPAEELRWAVRPAGILAVLFAALWFLPPRVLQSGWKGLMFGPGSELQKALRVTPEGGDVTAGEPVAVTVETLLRPEVRPRLLVQTRSGWAEPRASIEGRFSLFQLQPVIEPTHFKVLWKNLESRVFTFTPVEPPRLTDFRVTAAFPDYRGLEPVRLDGEPQGEFYRGTRLRIEARATRPLKNIEMADSRGLRTKVELSQNRRAAVSFSVSQPFDFWFEMTDEEGRSPAVAVRYRILVKEDAAPAVQVLAPSDDLLAGSESELPFTFELKDDIGVSAVYLNVSREGGFPAQRSLLKSYRPVRTSGIDQASWNLGRARARPGEVLRLRLEAVDNDQVTGPKSGFSREILVEVQSYEKEHARIESDLEKFRDDLIRLLADQTAARLAPEEWGTSAAEAAVKSQEDILERTGRAQEDIESILAKMERDPLSDFSTWSEHEAIRSGMESLREGPMRAASDALRQGRFQQASREQENAVSELERLSSLSESVHKYGKMRDLVHSADRLLEKGENLSRGLETGDLEDDELRRNLEETLKEAFQILSEMRRQLDQLPKELPEDFINQPAVKQMKLSNMADSASRLGESLKSGDLRAALEAARDLLRQAREAREAIREASEGIHPGGAGDMRRETEEKASALDGIIERQEQLLGKTGAFENKRRAFQNEAQKKLLKELAGRQKTLLKKARTAAQGIESAPERPPGAVSLAAGLRSVEPSMEKVLKELEEENVMFSQMWLKEIVDRVRKEEASLAARPEAGAKPGNGLLQEAREVAGGEQTILDLLKNPPRPAGDPFSKEEREAMAALAKEQSSLIEETESVMSEVAELSRESAILGPGILTELGRAGSEMKAAAGSLSRADSGEAQGQEQKALSHLRQGQESLGEAGGKFSRVQKMGGQGGPGFIQRRDSGTGRSGFRTGIVRIPGAEEYLPPKEFREEMLESLKERYPESEGSRIKDYYRRLAQ
ncbi:MAG: hypothetical protein A2902_04530 [Elusimicrobia bacterium RIFCSPLOWO2_01_FULL_64_13]|nr:MAG: hypothetical protein A2902_04530 [Elusimicrobia bacterium RIFCSPLOWO2_01_FULL_64_13]